MRLLTDDNNPNNAAAMLFTTNVRSYPQFRILSPQLTTETIKLPHLSYPYNPIIAEMLYKTTFLENWGSGAGRIIDACHKEGVPEPTWRTEGGFVIVTFQRPGVPQDVPQGGTQDVPQDVPQDVLQDGTQGGTQGDTEDDAQDKNLDVWIENQIILRPKITTEELASLKGVTSKTIKRHIAKMPHIKYVGSGYSGHWEVINKTKKK